MRDAELPAIVARSRAMAQVMSIVDRVAASTASVLVTGEHGTGKEVVARVLHARSQRSGRAFVAVNAGGLADGVLESELFGHIKGAFTDARTDRIGCFELADGGTLFLDEIANMPLGHQAKLLRVLQTGELTPVGASRPRRVDVRVIAATNRDLGAEIRKGTFREDLFYRLNVVSIDRPPLRERRGDIAPLASFFLRRYATENGKAIDTFADDALDKLHQYDWPGNVRELENVVERAVVLCDASSARIEKKHLPPTVVPSDERDGPPPIPGSTIAELERYAILKTLEVCGGSTSKAATVLGISPRKIQYKLHEYEMPASAPANDEVTPTGEKPT
jgi:DNA-binding NtrC family response regulator